MKIKISRGLLNKKLNLLSITILLGVLMFSSGCTVCGTWPFRKCVSQRDTVNLVVWNLWDNKTAWDPMITSYQDSVEADPDKPKIKVTYYKKTFDGSANYEDELQEAMIKGEGPDIITVNNSWMPRYVDKVSPLDGGAKVVQGFQRKFVDVAADDFLINDKIYAVPLSVDTMALYYNVDILKSAGIFDAPRTWDEFKDAVTRLTVRDDKGIIVRAGAALGTDKNINRASDILSLLMLQSGSSIVDAKHTKAIFSEAKKGSNGEPYSIGSMALQFYTDFANPARTIYTWNPLMDYSIDAFYQGRAAMMFNYNYNFPVVRAKAPNLNFAVAPMPQITGAMTPVNYANYWGMAVSSGSKHKEEAWDFLTYITNPEISKLYLDATAKPTAQRDQVAAQENGEDLNLAVFAKQAVTAKAWYQKNNFSVETIFNDAINSVVLARSTPQNASQLAETQLTQTMKVNK